MAAEFVPNELPIDNRTVDLARTFFYSITSLLIIALSTLARRIYIKVHPVWAFGWDDAFVLLGAMLSIANYGMLLYPWVLYVKPNPTLILPLEAYAKSGELAYISIIVWSCSMASIKVSIALTLLRFFHHVNWRIFLYAMIVLQVMVAIATALWLTLQCRPLYFAWSIAPPPGACAPVATVRLISNATSAFNIVTDVILSLLPLQFIIKLHRPTREKALLGALMAVGLMASIASIIKTTVITKFGDPKENPINLNIALITWTPAEELLSVTAACLPSMKMPLQRMLGRLGFQMTTTVRPTTYGNHSAVVSRVKLDTQRSIRLGPVIRKPAGTADDDDDDQEMLAKEFEAAMKDKALLSQVSSNTGTIGGGPLHEHEYSSRGRDEPFDIGLQRLPRPHEPV